MCLGFEVKAVDLPTVGKCDASGWSQGIIDISVERKDQTKLVFEVDQSHKDQMSQLGVIFYFSYPNNVVNLVVDGNYSNGLNVNGDYKVTGINPYNYRIYLYRKNEVWYVGQTTTSNLNTIISAADSESGGSGCNKPTINTNSIQNVSAGTTLSQITISVNDNGNGITGHQWKVNGANQNDNYVLQAGQTYSLTYEVTNECGTSSKDYSVTIQSNGGQAPTINTTSLSITPGMNLSEVQMDVDLHGCTKVSHHWKVDGIDIDANDNYVFQANHSYSIYYEITSTCGTSSKTYELTTSNGGSGTSSYHIRCTSGNYGNNGGTVIELNENSGCYYTTSTTPLLYSNWQFEDSGNNVIPLRTEFSFFVWGNENQLYNNNNGNTLTSIQPLQHCGWDRTNSYTSNCASYSGPYYTLYIYQKNGEWYASETCNGTVPSTLSITPNTAQKVACEDITFLASESSNSLEWYYGSTKLSNGNGITINGNSLTISPSYVYANGSANV